MLKSLIARIKASSKLNSILTVFLLISFALYIFSIPSFSARPRFYIISYGLMLLCGLFVFLKYLFYEKFVFNRRLLILLVFAIEAFIGTALHSHDFRHWLSIVLMFITLVIFYYGFCTIKNKRLIFKVIALSFFAFGLYFAFTYRSEILKINLDTPLGNDFDNVNTVGTYFSLSSAFFLYLALTNEKKLEWLYLIPSAIMLGLGLFTGSRHFIITTGVTFFVTIIVGFKRKKWIAAITIVVTVALFFAIIQLPQLALIKERIDRGITTLFGIGNAKFDPSVVQRTIWPQYGFNIGSRVMLFGYGAEGFSIYSGIGTYSHNTYSEIICNFGIIGAVIFYFSFLYCLILAIRSRDRRLNIVYVVVTFYIVKGFFGVYFASKDAYMMIALIMFLTKDIRLGNYVGFGVKNSLRSNTYCEVSI